MKIQAIRGMNDILPEATAKWRHLEQIIYHCLRSFGYQEIRLPIVENTNLFKRSIGEITDIVQKEMYTFRDLNGDSISLRPEGTAGCVRACIEHNLLYKQTQKLWYLGPMFRHERPQKGRYRQFNQLGVEVLGISDYFVELELLLITQRLWQALKINNLVLELNTLGSPNERQLYKQKLQQYFKNHRQELDDISLQRLEKNPLRILDSKNPQMQALLADAPTLWQELNPESQASFKNLCRGLDTLNIDYKINHRLVRGLDYYNHTVFEWMSPQLGSQSTVCAGGRYDNLINELGGEKTFAVGFAMGLERLILLLDDGFHETQDNSKTFYFIVANSQGLLQSLQLTTKLCQAGYQVINPNKASSFKSQFKKADKSSANYALILGEEEISHQRISIKNLRQSEEQISVAQNELISYLNRYLEKS